MNDIVYRVREYARQHGISGDALAAPPAVAESADDEAAPTEIRCTDIGNARRFAHMHTGIARYCHELLRWYVWDGRRLREDATGEVLRKARRVVAEMWRELPGIADRRERDERYAWSKRSESAERLAAMVRLAQSEPGIHVAADELDADRWLLNCLNGTIDLRTGALLPHDPGNLITRLAPVAYDPRATAPTFASFVERILPDPGLRAYVQRVLGYCITGTVGEQLFPIAHGSGANGKSTLFDLVRHVLGDYCGDAPESLLIARTHPEHPTELASLMGRRLVLASETEQAGRLRVQLMKRLCGDSTLTARFMRGDYFSFARTFKVWLVTNNRPQIAETTEAVWRRIRLIPFDVTIPPDERDPDLPEKLKSESPGVLRWLVEGCLAWQREGLADPPAVTTATGHYRSESDPLADFVNERLVIGHRCRVSRADLWSAFQSWNASTGERLPTTRNELFDRVRKVPGVADAEWRFGGVSTRGFRGVGLTSPQESAADTSDCQ